MTDDSSADREYSFKTDQKRKVWKAAVGSDLFYTMEGKYKVYQRINPSDLEKPRGNGPRDPGISRRSLIKYGSVAAVSIALGSTLVSYYYGRSREEGSDIPPVKVEEFPRREIATIMGLEVGRPIDFRYPLDDFNSSSFIVKLGRPAIGGIGPEGDVVAFNYLCTHMGCALIGMYKHEQHMLGPCPCHFTRFDLTKNGMVIIGQATENLPQVTLEVEGENIYATGVMRLIYGYRSNLPSVKPVEVA